MSGSAVNPTYYADFSGLEGLKKGAKADDPKAIREAARQFESLFTNMLLKTMRESKLADGLGDSQETDFYQGMFDQQLAVQMSQGKGIGLAEMLVHQLTRSGLAKSAGAGGAAAATGMPVTSAAATSAAAPSATSAPGTTSAASTSTSTSTSTAPVSDADRISFVQSMAPYAERAASALGVASDTLIAQAALETGWGQHLPTDASGGSSFNLFGIKGGGRWGGASTEATTIEYGGGSERSVAQPFRAYASVQQGVDDYVNLLQASPRYRQALGTGDNTHAFAMALQRGGYATDPNYGQKLETTAASVKALRTAAATSLKLYAGVPTTVGGESA